MDELFSPPYSEELLLKRRKIKRELLSGNTQWIEKKVAILGGSTTHDVKDAIDLFLLYQGIRAEFYESEYNQFWQDIMFDNSGLEQFQPDVIYIHTGNRNVEYPKVHETKEAVTDLLNSTYRRFETMWERIDQLYGCVVIQNNFEYPYWRLRGNREASDIHGSVNYLTRLNLMFAEYAEQHELFFLHDLNYLSARYGIDKWSDPFYWYMYKCAVATPAIPMLAHSVTNIIKSIYGKNKKAFALDLDNTLWGGVVGDDGVENLKIGKDTPVGQIYSDFQEYLKQHREMGVVLNVISKNEEEAALAGLRHPDMCLHPDDFVTIKANWEPKSKNLIDMASVMSLTPDSFVFVDDNPAERDIIRQQLKGVAVPELDEKPEKYMKTIDHMGYFEMTVISDEDSMREKMYHENVEREKYEHAFLDYQEYLKSLEMKAEIDSFTPVYYGRIAQLTNKSNQFNLTTKRYTQGEIERIAADDNYITLYGKLMDKFGDNGVVSLVIGQIVKDICSIDLWVMSCRVLKRGMECAMMDRFVAKCKERGVKTIQGFYYPTPKNGMVKEFFGEQGFQKVGEDEKGNSSWQLVIDKYEKKQYHMIVSSKNG